MEITYIILAAFAASLMLMQINQRLGSPVIAIVDRWLRWLIFTFGAAQACVDFELIDRPYWVLVTVFFLFWFLAETAFNWLRIRALSVSPLPLFPRYIVNAGGHEWPIQPRLLKLREWLRTQGFRQQQSLKAEIGGGIYLRVSVYQNAAGTVRVQVTFIPQASGAITACYALSSLTEDGRRFVTDNLYVPFAGFYPENWYVERMPWCRSLGRLLIRHQKRLARAGVTLAPFAEEPLVELNQAQKELDRLNTELGFLHTPPQREDLGKITHEGRYRVWKEIWTLNYLGRARRYV
jgi:hypothetical protein